MTKWTKNKLVHTVHMNIHKSDIHIHGLDIHIHGPNIHIHIIFMDMVLHELLKVHTAHEFLWTMPWTPWIVMRGICLWKVSQLLRGGRLHKTRLWTCSEKKEQILTFSPLKNQLAYRLRLGCGEEIKSASVARGEEGWGVARGILGVGRGGGRGVCAVCWLQTAASVSK